MKTMQPLVRTDPDRGQLVLYVAEECQHTQWFDALDLEFGLSTEHCRTCDNYGIRVTWHRIWVEK